MSTEHAIPRTGLSVSTEQDGDGATRLVDGAVVDGHRP
jgi:hypothetical protein